MAIFKCSDAAAVTPAAALIYEACCFYMWLLIPDHRRQIRRVKNPC